MRKWHIWLIDFQKSAKIFPCYSLTKIYCQKIPGAIAIEMPFDAALMILVDPMKTFFTKMVGTVEKRAIEIAIMPGFRWLRVKEGIALRFQPIIDGPNGMNEFRVRESAVKLWEDRRYGCITRRVELLHDVKAVVATPELVNGLPIMWKVN